MLRKTTILALFLLIPLSSFSATGGIHVLVKGMVCSFCAQGITKKFSAQPSVDRVDVNLGKKRVDLTLKPGQSLDDGTIQKILTDAGYTVEKIDRD